jgi:hypothetical protein
MSEGFTQLQELGAQKISEHTHISKQHVQALIQENFKALSKVQFLGFISIIERDYHIDLSELKEKGVKFYGESVPFGTASVFMEKKSKKSSKGIYILVALIIFVVAIYYNIDSEPSNMDVNATQVESVTQEIEALVENNVSDINVSSLDENQSEEASEETDLNGTFANEKIAGETTSNNTSKSLKIVANKKLWFGYIELDTENKNQKAFSGEFDLDATKNWLLLFGHNNVEIELNGQAQEFEKNKNVQFLYKDGKLTQISLDEFKKLNKGRKW